MVDDLAAVADAAALARFALLGKSQGGAVSIAYAARHPDRVSHLVLCGAFARGVLRRDPSADRREAVAAMIRLIELGWGSPTRRSCSFSPRSSSPRRRCRR
jgi:pimeloyl-ACP methyl ester carboxylesterase